MDQIRVLCPYGTNIVYIRNPQHTCTFELDISVVRDICGTLIAPHDFPAVGCLFGHDKDCFTLAGQVYDELRLMYYDVTLYIRMDRTLDNPIVHILATTYPYACTTNGYPDYSTSTHYGLCITQTDIPLILTALERRT
jgi:hypothetical protein